MPDYKIYTVGWICGTGTELIAALELLDYEEPEPVHAPANDNNNYTIGRIGKHNVVVAALAHERYGTTSAATVARDMVRTFPNIRIGLMVGIGGGVPTKHDVRLGDVVVSSPSRRYGGVIQYDFGKAIQGQGLMINGSLNQPPISILTAMTKLRAIHTRRGHKLAQTIQEVLERNKRLSSEYHQPHPDSDKLYRTEFVHGANHTCCAIACDDSNIIARSARSANEDNPKIHYGLIASGNQVMQDAIIRDRLSAEEEVLCFETEAAGLNNHFPCVIIRGICDYSDSHKYDEWKGYAAITAAAYAKELLLYTAPQKVEAEQRVQDLLADAIEPISRTKEEVGALKLKADREDSLRILDWLSPVDYTLLQNDLIQQHQRGTGQWFLKSEKFQEWLRAKGSILFCPGMPGAGKTITTAIAVDYLRSKSREDCSTGVAYVYCNYEKRNTQQTQDLLASLLKQLAQSLSSFPDVVTSLYVDNNHGRDKPSIQEIIQTLQAVVHLYSTTFIVVDALDEYEATDGCGTTFLSEMCALRDQTTTNLFITSRPSQKIHNELQPCLVQEIYAHDPDVRQYVDHWTAQMLVLKDDNTDLPAEKKKELRVLIRERVSNAVNGIFLVARFEVESLKDKTTPNQILAALEKLSTDPKAYENSYKKTILRIKNQGTEHRDLARRALTWLTFAQRPLTMLELRHALSVRVGSLKLDEGDLQSTNVIVHVCMGLVRIEEGSNTVSLLHPSTMEYLQANPSCLSSLGISNFSGDLAALSLEANQVARKHLQREIAATCATYLSTAASMTGVYDNDWELDSQQGLYPLYAYAAENWGNHAFEAGPCSKTMTLPDSEAHVAASSQLSRSPKPGAPFHFDKITHLHLAAHLGSESEATNVLKNEDSFINNRRALDTRASHEETPLICATMRGQEDVSRQLLEVGQVKPGLNIEGDYSELARTILSYVAELGQEKEEFVKLLLQLKGISLDPEDPGRYSQHGRAIISHAAEDGQTNGKVPGG